MNTTENNKLIAEFMGLNLLNSTINPVSLKESQIVIGRKYIDTREGKIFECTKTAFPLVIVQDNENGYYCANIKHCKEIYFNKELQYNSSWDWLMPVVEKINQFENQRFSCLINSMDCNIFDNKKNKIVASSFGRFNPSELKDSIFTAIIEFIKWYNEQK